MKRPDIGGDGVDCFSFPLELSMYGQTLPFHDVLFFRENVTLWNELVELRQKHQRQQQIVNKVNLMKDTPSPSNLLIHVMYG